MGRFPEVFFESSRNFILPQSNETNIGIMNNLNGYMFALSYHLYADDMARCYWIRNGKIQRFFKEDIKLLWPSHFVHEMFDAKQKCDDYVLDRYKPLPDEKFRLFYEETIN